jgi:hypothetical protein
MSRKPSRGKLHNRERCFASCLRDFLTPALFRQVYRALAKGRKRRWTLQPVLYVLLCMTWCLGDSQPERFETARAFCVACHPKRRRPGKTFCGFQKALEALPASVLRAVAAVFRKHLLVRFGPLLPTDGWLVFGCDGSRLRAPRTEELQQRLGDPGGDSQSGHKPPQVWLTALVHLASGMPWSWMVGKGDASERDHLGRLVWTLPAGALVVTDAGYQAYLLACKLVAGALSFLMRVSAQTIFYTADTDMATAGEDREVTPEALAQWTDGVVYYWPKEAQRKKQKPLQVRLIRIRAKKKKNDVWLVTDVLDQTRLTVAMASKFYKMRWENEGYFRTYKQTLKKVKLCGRTVAAVHREVLGSMLAVQVLLAQGAAGALALGRKQAANSARQLVLLVRREMAGALRGRARQGFLERAAACQREQRQRSSNKQKTEWPSRQAPKPLLAPRIRQLDEVKFR